MFETIPPNPFSVEEACSKAAEASCFVIFVATGDITCWQLLPALL